MTNADLLGNTAELLNPQKTSKDVTIGDSEANIKNSLKDIILKLLNIRDNEKDIKDQIEVILSKLDNIYKYCACKEESNPLQGSSTEIITESFRRALDECKRNHEEGYGNTLGRMKTIHKKILEEINNNQNINNNLKKKIKNYISRLPILDTCYSSEKARQLEKALEELHSRLCDTSSGSSGCCDKFAKFLVLLIAAYATASIDPKRIREIEWFLLLARAAADAIPGSSNDKYLPVCPYIGDAIAVYYYYVDRGCNISKIQPDDVKDIIAKLVNL